MTFGTNLETASASACHRRSIPDPLVQIRLAFLGAALLLFSAYRWKVRLFELHQQRLQVERDQLEAKVTARTAELTKEIAERRQTEEQLRRSQTQLAQAQQIARMGSWEWDLVTNLVSWSKQTQELYGWTPADIGRGNPWKPASRAASILMTVSCA